MQKQHKLLTFLSIICILSVICMFLVLTSRDKPVVFTPPPFDATAEKGNPAIPNGLGYQMLDAQIFHAGICGEIIRTGDTIEVWFTNPESNSVWLKLRITDTDGRILGETGMLSPGQYVRYVILNTVPKPGTPIILKVMAYEPETYYSAGSFSINTYIQ